MTGPAGSAMRWLGIATLTATLACGDAEPSDTGSEAEAEANRGATPDGASPRSAEDLATRLRQPDVEALLAAVAQTHAQVRGPLGPHTLHVTTDFSLTPVDAAPSGARPLDEPVVQGQQIHDEVTLRFTTDAETGDLRLSLSQANDHERGRDVVVADQQIHVRKAHRAWFHYPRDSDVIEQWLDDALHGVHDVIELAAPRLTVEGAVLDGAGLDGEPAVEITLGLSEQTRSNRVAAGPTQGWRADAELTGIEGTVRLDLAHGIWQEAEVEVRYLLPGADGQPLSGRVHLRGTLTPDPSVEVSPPPDSQPLPSRLRYDHEQRQLLDGLAAP